MAPHIPEYHKLDTATEVLFYEQEFYVLSNFSSFAVEVDGKLFPTSEHAYHYAKFKGHAGIAKQILEARSAHQALTLSREYKELINADWWAQNKVPIMLNILRHKANQHEYVRRKLLETGDRRLVEDSWRDDFWGWGPNKDGLNMLGVLWEQVRAVLRLAQND